MKTPKTIHRVIIDSYGKAVSFREAVEEYNIVPDVVLIRDDYWILGTTKELYEVAFNLWWDHWIEILTYEDFCLSPKKYEYIPF